ncbi:prephenate dehydratase [Peribacillus deserti]|uniref:Prephenate dehydratase n=1 Tax=Peribacillus deserti TaxID=673318 RepID=A0A2N5M701_9BACI|nr:prephenate dehydratase [Peribacillus deserti]PLT30130.1 prephenate dehydratase [Peribacillus deserti]
MGYKVAFLGPRATFTDLAAAKLFPDEERMPLQTIPACFEAVQENQADIALIPIENTLEGSVNITLDYLVHEVDLPIQGEVVAPISQHLMVHPAHRDHWESAETIFSHSHAIAQCHKFLHKNLRGAACEAMTSTAAAAQYVLAHPELKIAAIANELAAKEYNLEIVKHNIHDFAHNHTRFIAVSKKEIDFGSHSEQENGAKTTLMVTLPADHPGALHQVLSAFSWRKLNLSKIESRPMKTGLGNYFFIIDINMEMDHVLIPSTIAELEALGCSVKVLGSYPSFLITNQAKSFC